MSWHKQYFKEQEMSNLKIERIELELKRLVAQYGSEPDKIERDKIDSKFKKLHKELNKIKELQK